MLANKLENKFLKAFENVKYGKIKITLPNNKTYSFSGAEQGADAELTINDSSMILNLYARGDIGFADDYRHGKWDSQDLVALVDFCLSNEEALQRCIFGSGLFRAIVRFAYLFKQNSVKGSKANIHAHYDIGNSFYKLWLDETMSYSSAIFQDNNEALANAQLNKYDRILSRLQNCNNTLEVGCGWGGFMDRATQLGANDVKGITISDEQFAFAKERLKDKGKVELIDYRKLNGKYSNIVSIEMFEVRPERIRLSAAANARSIL